ncbi:hypothetical protein [Alteraurantiacibacter buctensis]|uniref:Uncharacterized protein n=1 Tax=Alteraurantiacibacter buctensis TaxID=1503981 RepID=A0A844YUP9_9SPHN|nr:hypothetical protein [Alteraurantiacibacter buctensis]MXO70581.1 hypothetical protein [Alteraurantiacibacter buctensis]
MFEGKPPLTAPQTGPAASLVEGDSLRELTWGDLRLRLAAARDLRLSLAREAVREAASFDAPVARQVAALEHGLDNGKEVVNPSDLANGKGIGGTPAASHDGSLYQPLRN